MLMSRVLEECSLETPCVTSRVWTEAYCEPNLVLDKYASACRSSGRDDIPRKLLNFACKHCKQDLESSFVVL